MVKGIKAARKNWNSSGMLAVYHKGYLQGIPYNRQQKHGEYKFSTLLAFVGSVAVFAVAFYCWKSKAENLEKIKQNNPKMTMIFSDFFGMASQ